MAVEPAILIVGAGPVGLTAAVELARRGRTVHIIDKGTGPSGESRALGVNARTLEILEPSGVTREMLARGQKLRRLNFNDPPKLLFSIEFDELDHRYNFMLALPQADTERLLMAALEGLAHEVHWQRELVELTRKSEGVDCRWRTPDGEHTASFDTVIGADGAHSFVREAAGIGFDGDSYPNDWSLADVRLARTVPRDEANVFQLEGSIFGMLPLPEGRFRLISSLPDVLDHVPVQFEVAEVFWQSQFCIAHRQVETYQKGDIFLCGDAAHVHSPVGGRGMNLGIEDAATLAHMIDTGATAGYSAARHPVGRHVLQVTERQTRIFTSQSFVPRILRRYVFPFIARLPAFRARGLPEMAGLAAPHPAWLPKAD